MSDTNEPVVDAQNNSNVVGINEKKRGRPRKTPKPSENLSDVEKVPNAPTEPPPLKLRVGEIERDLVALLDKVPINDFTPFPLNQVPQYPYDVRVFRSKLNDPVCLVYVENNTAHFTDKDNVASDLAAFTGQLAGSCGVYNAGLGRCEKAVKAWAYKQRPLVKIPPPWGFKSDPQLCFNRLSYDPIDCGAGDLDNYAPTFAEMSSRTRNDEAFWARIGSIFFPDASRKQVLWLWGPSGGGKSQVSPLLKALIGDSYVGFDNEDFEDAFWKADLIDKRVAYIKEADPNFLLTKVFKSLTGDAGQRMNQKFIKAFPGLINTIVVAVSNNPPSMPNDEAIKNRVIPCYIEKVPEHRLTTEAEIEARFKKEAPYIAGFCMKVYQTLCPHRGDIKFDREKHLQPAIDNYESEFLDIIDDHFRILSPDSPEYEKDLLTAKFFKNALITAGLVKEDQRCKFKDFLKARHPQVRETRTKTRRVWVGITTQ